MRYINEKTGQKYWSGTPITVIRNGVLFSGIPSVEQLTEWGFVEYIPPEPPEPQPTDEISAEEALDIITNGE